MIGHARYQRMAAAASTLTPDEHAALAAHLAGCDTCRGRVADYRLQDDFLRAFPLGAPPRSALSTVLTAPGPGTRPRASYGALGRGMVVLLAVLLLVALSTVALAAGGVIRVFRPENRISPGTDAHVFVAPALPPYQSVRFRTLDPRAAAQQSGYAIAYLRTPPSDISASVGVDISPHVGWPSTPPGPQPRDPRLRGMAVAIRSVVRYGGAGHTVILSLVEPSPKVIKTRELLLGQRTVTLPNGQDAWISDNANSALPFVHTAAGGVHVLAWVSGRYVVTLFSDLPFSRLRWLAPQVAVVPPAGNPAQRGIPASWPTPVPPPGLPSRLHVRVDGTAVRTSKGSHLTLHYFFNFGSYSQGALYGLDKWSRVSIRILFPPSLRSRTHEAQPHQAFSGGGMGMGGSVMFNTAGMNPASLKQALHQGLTIHVAWTEKGKRRQQIFRYPIIPASQCNRDPSCSTALGIR